MATNVKVTIGRNVPIVDDTGLTLAILTHKLRTLRNLNKLIGLTVSMSYTN